MRTTARVRTFVRRRSRWWSAGTEALLLAVVLFAFTRLHGLVGSDVVSATAHAHGVQSVERSLHLDVELSVNRWLVAHDALIPASVLVYRTYYVVLAAVLVWVFVRHAELYLRVRRTLIVMLGLALLAFWAFPVSPPRFALPGVVDVVAGHDLVADPAATDLANGANFTAMPSLHVGWSAWAAYAAWLSLRPAHPRGALLVWLFPLVMVAVVLGTGNHYVLDVVGSAVLLAISVAGAAGWGRLFDRRRTRTRATGR